jgi:hypothetical protein
MMRVSLLLVAAFLSVGCVPDPGPAPYTGGEDFDAKAQGDVAFLEGPAPYREGALRLSVGLAYEGHAIETHGIDGVTSHSYIYILDQCDETSALTYSPGTSVDRVEGKRSDLVTQGSLGWWGHGVHWDRPKDMRTWGAMHLSVKALSGHEALEVHMGSSGPEGAVDPCDPTSGASAAPSQDVLASVDASTYGYAADGEWHTLTIPLSAFEGVDLGAVNIPFSLTHEGGAQGDQLLFDNLYFTP